ncbi:hypothetical protein OPT61_g4114 [Boeremia exigua]|uniref:Uncharacterized protein n=1 Tax=Boeremia exigua TaxID=749465 RepID=A0ACC2IFD7_9PLEO|nr:hypothetical protein OPT61_g4114 [Boeremia exigua]
MAHSQKRKRTNLTSARPAKRQRKPPLIFEQGVNPTAPVTPPATIRRVGYSQALTQSEPSHGSVARASPSPLFEPDPSQLVSTAADILGEDEDEEELFNLAADDDNEVEDEAVRHALAAATAVEPGGSTEQPAIVTASAAQSTQQQQRASLEINNEAHLHFRWRACWGSMEKNAIASASRFTRNKRMSSVSESELWQWADRVVESQKPRVAKVDCLTATLYHRQAKGDRCTIALQRARYVVSEDYVYSNWYNLQEQVKEMDQESIQLLSCDFDLVLREEPAATVPLVLPQPVTRGGAVRARPGIVTAIQEEGLADVVSAERFASGTAIGIRDRWRCREERCSNSPFICWVRRPPGRQIDRFDDHYPVNGNIIAR